MMIFFFLFIPVIMIICGLFMYKFPPKNSNAFIGYRTRRSRLNSDTWLFANRYCGKLWLILGLIMLLLIGIAAILFTIIGVKLSDAVNPSIVQTIELAVLLISIIPVEVTLKRSFDENGSRR